MFATLPMQEEIGRCRRCVEWVREKHLYERQKLTREPKTDPSDFEHPDSEIERADAALAELSRAVSEFDLRDWAEKHRDPYTYLDKEVEAWLEN